MNTPEPISVRYAQPEDGTRILELERELAEFERLAGPSDEEGARLLSWIFKEKKFESLVAEREGRIIGVALYFFFPASFRARPGLYLEDLIIARDERSFGAGEALLRELSRIACEKNCIRMEWAVLDWNERAMQFYRRLGARPQSEWVRYYLDEAGIEALAVSGRNLR
jgi:GNAT superfamily N-acetyltransferase